MILFHGDTSLCCLFFGFCMNIVPDSSFLIIYKAQPCRGKCRAHISAYPKEGSHGKRVTCRTRGLKENHASKMAALLLETKEGEGKRNKQ